MSTPPAGNVPGKGSSVSGKAPPPRLLTRPKASPLVTRKTKKPAPNAANVTATEKKGPVNKWLGDAKERHGMMELKKKRHMNLSAQDLSLSDRPHGDPEPSLFTNPPPAGEYKDYPVYTTKKALLEGLRLHVARLMSHKPVDVRDSTQFTPPLYLLRRDIRAALPGAKEEPEIKEESQGPHEPTAEETEREAAKAAARAEIAPSQGGTKPRQKQPTKKTSQVFMKEQTAEQKYRAQLKYEEALPWHLEDDEHKQLWMGTYEAMSSSVFAQIAFEDRAGEDVAVMTPLEKWYKFTPKARVDAEVMRKYEEQQLARIKKEEGAERDFMKKFADQMEKEERLRMDDANARGRMFIAKGKSDQIGIKNEEELDFEEDWADDEAPQAIEGEEDDVKDIEKRIKADQAKSNVFDIITEKEYEDEADKERRAAELRKKVGKKTAKALVKRENNAIYEDDEENEYAESSDSTDDEALEAAEKEEKEKKEAEAKAAGGAGTATNPPSTSGGNKPGSGASSRNNTPGHRSSKHPEPLVKTAAASGLKRPGSPGLSEASGNESSTARKKQKTKNKILGSKLVSSTNTPSRPQSPANGASASTAPGARPTVSARGSFAGSGGRSPSPNNAANNGGGGGSTPNASRIGSRAASPDTMQSLVAAQKQPPAASNSQGPKRKYNYVPSNEELAKLIPPQGIRVKEISRYFEISEDDRKQLLSRFKQVARYDKETKTLRPQTDQAAAGSSRGASGNGSGTAPATPANR